MARIIAIIACYTSTFFITYGYASVIIDGYVKDAINKRPIVNVAVSIDDENIGDEGTDYTTFDGYFSLEYKQSCGEFVKLSFTVEESDYYSPAHKEPFVKCSDSKIHLDDTLLTCKQFNFITTDLPDGIVGQRYFGGKIDFECGMPPHEFNISEGKIPNGLVLSDAGVISGTPTTMGNFNFEITIKDNDGIEGNNPIEDFTINIYEKLKFITNDILPYATKDNYYSFLIEATGGDKNKNFIVISTDDSNNDFSLSSDGRLTGTPANNRNSYSFLIRVNTDNNDYDVKNFILEVYPELKITRKELIDGIIGKRYQDKVTIFGGKGPYLWTVYSGKLPLDLRLVKSNGEIIGIPPKDDYAVITISVTDFDGHVAFKEFILQVVKPLKLYEKNIPIVYNDGKNKISTVPLTVSGGIPPYYYKLIDNEKEWLGIDPYNGVLIITDDDSRKFNAIVRVQDSSKTNPQSVDFELNIDVVKDLTILNNVLFQDVPINKKIDDILIETTGGGSVIQWLIKSGLPKGITLENGIISGNPQEAGDFTFIIQVIDNYNNSAEKECIWKVHEELKFERENITVEVIEGYEFHFMLKAEGGLAPYTFTKTTGELPVGLQFDNKTGSISGVCANLDEPTVLKFKVEDSVNSNIDRCTVILTKKDALLMVQQKNLPNGKVGEKYDATISVSGGSKPYYWNIVDSGLLPDNINFFDYPTSGILTGTPTKKGIYKFQLIVSDSSTPSNVVSIDYTVVIYDDPKIANKYLKDAIPGKFYSETIRVEADTGQPPYKFEIGGRLPDGLTYNASTGVISGEVFDDALSSFIDITVTDSCEFQSYDLKENMLIRVTRFPLQIDTVKINDRLQNEYFSYTLQASGGNGQYIWSIISDTFLPKGVELDMYSGVISGTPEVSGSFKFIVCVKDESRPDPQEAYKPFNLNVRSNLYDIIGEVKDIKNNLFAFIQLEVGTIIGSGNIKESNVMTELSGRFRFTNIPMGNYKIIPSCEYCDIEPTEIDIKYYDLGKHIILTASNCTVPLDRIKPGIPNTLKSDIEINKWTKTKSININWSPSEDNMNGSGIAGYIYILDNNPGGIPEMKNSNRTTYNEVTFENIIEEDEFYFHISAVDIACNIGDTITSGPFKLDTKSPENCSVSIIERNNDNQVLLRLTGHDTGSGMGKVELSNDLLTWSTPFDYTNYVSWNDNSNGSIYVKFSDKVGNKVIVYNGQARFIIIGGGNNNDSLWPNTEYSTNEVYNKLIDCGFEDYMIYYMINKIIYNKNNKSLVDDDYPEAADLKNAITNEFFSILNPDTPLFIYFHGAIDESNMRIKLVGNNGNGYIYADSLKKALDELQERVNCTVVFILDSYFSHDFGKLLYNEYYPKRIIITSGNYPSTYEKSTFSKTLFESLIEGNNLNKAFKNTKNELAINSNGNYSPSMDCNGDGEYLDSKEGILASQIFMNVPTIVLDRPVIGQINVNIIDNQSIKFDINAYDDDSDITKVSAKIFHENFNMQNDLMYEFDLDYNSETKNYEKTITDLDVNILYQMIINVENNNNEISLPARFNFRTNIKHGDFNLDNIINFDDAIITLDYLVNNYMELNPVLLYSDVNNNNKIGIEEVIYILRKTAQINEF